MITYEVDDPTISDTKTFAGSKKLNNRDLSKVDNPYSLEPKVEIQNKSKPLPNFGLDS